MTLCGGIVGGINRRKHCFLFCFSSLIPESSYISFCCTAVFQSWWAYLGGIFFKETLIKKTLNFFIFTYKMVYELFWPFRHSLQHSWLLFPSSALHSLLLLKFACIYLSADFDLLHFWLRAHFFFRKPLPWPWNHHTRQSHPPASFFLLFEYSQFKINFYILYFS